MDEVTCEVQGLAELEAKLEELATSEARRIVRAGLYAGAGEMVTAMQESGSHISGELGSQLRNKKTWKKSTRLTRGDELAGVARVKPTGALPEVHTGEGSTKFFYQPKGRKYHRSIAYLVKLLEFGGSGGEYHGLHFPLMTSGFESGKGKVIERVVAAIKDRLGI